MNSHANVAKARTNPPGADLLTPSMGFAHMGQLTLFKIVPYDFVNSFAGLKGEGQDARSNLEATDGNPVV